MCSNALKCHDTVIAMIHLSKSFSAWTLLVGWQEGHRPVKNGGMVEVGTGWFGWSGAQPDG